VRKPAVRPRPGSIEFELEFVGFTRFGVSPWQTLDPNIPRYQNLRGTGGSNSRFSNELRLGKHEIQRTRMGLGVPPEAATPALMAPAGPSG